MSAQLISQVKELLQQQDEQSLKFILSDQTLEAINLICSQLTQKQALVIKRLHKQSQGLEDNGTLLQIQESKGERNKRIDELLQKKEEKEQHKMQSFLQLLAKSNQKLRYMEEYGFPFYDLFKRIISTHGDFHPVMQTVKTLHSQVQILFTVLLKDEVVKYINNKFSNLDQGFKTYLSFIFSKQCQKYYNFQILYKNIKKSTQEQQSCDDQDQQARQIPLTQDQTLMIDQKQFLVNLAESVTIEEFQQFNRNRSYNFLCFGLKKFEAYLGLQQAILNRLKSKQLCQLVSFITIRFIRKIIFTIIRNRNHGKLIALKKPITFQEITIIGNELIDQYTAKVDQFLIPVKSIEQQAKQAFIEEFQTMNYQDFIPKRHIMEAKNKQLDPATYIWDHNKQYKVLWIQRVKAQRYIREGQKGQKPLLQYIQYIKSNQQTYKESSIKLWKAFIMNKFGYSAEVKIVSGKRIKLQSLND